MKKASKILYLCGLLLVLGMFLPGTKVQAAEVGYVNFTYLVEQHPDTAVYNKELQVLQEEEQTEYKNKEAGLSSDADKKVLAGHLGAKLEEKRREYYQLVAKKVVEAAKAVAKEKDIAIVIDSKLVVCGGEDITEDVLKKIMGK